APQRIRTATGPMACWRTAGDRSCYPRTVMSSLSYRGGMAGFAWPQPGVERGGDGAREGLACGGDGDGSAVLPHQTITRHVLQPGGGVHQRLPGHAVTRCF